MVLKELEVYSPEPAVNLIRNHTGLNARVFLAKMDAIFEVFQHSCFLFLLVLQLFNSLFTFLLCFNHAEACIGFLYLLRNFFNLYVLQPYGIIRSIGSSL